MFTVELVFHEDDSLLMNYKSISYFGSMKKVKDSL